MENSENVSGSMEASDPKKDVIDHEGISKYANFTLDVEDDQNN